MLGNESEDIREPSLWIHVVYLRRYDEAVHGSGALSAAIGAGEEPRLPAKGYIGAIGGFSTSSPRFKNGVATILQGSLPAG